MKSILRHAAILAALLSTLIAPAFAAEAGASHHSPATVLFLQITLILIVGRFFGEVCERLGLPAVMGQLIGGIVLGPSLFGLLAPDLQHAIFPPEPEHRQMLEGVAQFGVLLLLLLTGMETDFALLRRAKAAPFWVSVSGIVVPFTCGAALGWLLPASLLPHPELRTPAALFIGTALSISSVKILAMVIRDVGFTRRNLGQLMLAAAVIDDTIGWITIGIVLSIVRKGSIDAMALGWAVAGTFVFLGLSLTVGRRVVARAIRWSNDALQSEFPVVTTIIVVTCLMALATDVIGVHSVLGAFTAGVIIGQSPILTRHIDEQLRGLIGALFAPVFFGLAGLSADLTVLARPQILLLTLVLVAIASLGKFSGALIGGRFAGLRAREAFAVGCGMNARGSTEIIVATLGLSAGALSRDLFTMIVTMAVVTTLAMPPMLRWALRRVPISEAEQKRIEREDDEAKRFVPNIERVLTVIDHGPNALLAARLGGLLAASGRILTTVLPIDAGPAAKTPEGAIETAKAAAAEGADTARPATAGDTEESEAEKSGNEPEVEVRSAAEPAAAVETVLKHAEKGFGLLLIGLDETTGAGGTIDDHAGRLAVAFAGPFAIAIARGELVEHPRKAPIKILTAVSGTAVSRRGAELAVELGAAAGVPVEAIHVAADGRTAGGPWRIGWRYVLGADRGRHAALRELGEIAEARGAALHTAEVSSGEPADAILAAAKSAPNTLIVIGVNQRSGEQLDFGKLAARLLRDAPCSLLLVSS